MVSHCLESPVKLLLVIVPASWFLMISEPLSPHPVSLAHYMDTYLPFFLLPELAKLTGPFPSLHAGSCFSLMVQFRCSLSKDASLTSSLHYPTPTLHYPPHQPTCFSCRMCCYLEKSVCFAIPGVSHCQSVACTRTGCLLSWSLQGRQKQEWHLHNTCGKWIFISETCRLLF